MSRESRRLAGILLIVLPTVMFGGVSILRLLISDPTYMENPLRQDLWRAGHAHAGVLLLLSLITLRYVDEARLSQRLKGVVRSSIPISAILLPAAFFLSVLRPDARAPNGFVYLAYGGALLLATGSWRSVWGSSEPPRGMLLSPGMHLTGRSGVGLRPGGAPVNALWNVGLCGREPEGQ